MDSTRRLLCPLFCRPALMVCWMLLAVVCLTACNGRKSEEASSQERPLRVLFIGDSVTDGNWGGGGGKARPSKDRNQRDQNHIFGHGYMYLCAAHYMAYYPGRYEFFNRGISGHTLADLQARWDEDCLMLHPDVVSILIGINDAALFARKGPQSAEEFGFDQWESDYRSLILSTQQACPGVRIVLCSPFALRDGSIRETVVDRMGEIIARLARENDCVCLPYQQIFDKTLADFPQVDPTCFIWDGIHPTAGGHQIMADRWMEAFDKL